MVKQEDNTPFRLLLVVDMDCWQAGQLNIKNAIKALDAVLRQVYYILGKTGTEIDRRCIIVKSTGNKEEVDELLERFEGLQLVGPGRAVSDTELALLVASKSQVLASHRIVAVVAADHKIDVDALVYRRIGSLLNFAAGHTLTWTQKQRRETVEVSLNSIKKIEEFCASSEPLIGENNVSEVAIQDPSAINNVLLGESNNVQAPAKSPCHVPATAEKLPKDTPRTYEENLIFCLEDEGHNANILDFIPLIKSIRLAGINSGRKKKPLRSQVGQELSAISTWPIGKEGYTTFRNYADAAELAGFVLGDSSTGTIGSTGELEKILDINSTENYTRGWPRIR
ncbi:hypothetical protein FFLO_03650 [Filobasidium floriforme]|uniref:NYN domain-containing protein n=1 Tax=Filobasidium floriforme TaxID=5210 RepID=A0A8K0JKE1_9TREE|nr:hypothetical protein FFLO_03650 [Filobasidium floriforme]